MNRIIPGFFGIVKPGFTGTTQLFLQVAFATHPRGLDPLVETYGTQRSVSLRWLQDDITLMISENEQTNRFRVLVWDKYGLQSDSPQFDMAYMGKNWLDAQHVFDEEDRDL